MPNMEITNNSTRSLAVWEPVHESETLTAVGAETYVAGTLLGRITASGKLTHYASGAGDGSEVAIAILSDEEVFIAAGDASIRPIIAGRVRRGDLVAHGVGAITDAESDALRDYGIIPLATTQLSELDNQ